MLSRTDIRCGAMIYFIAAPFALFCRCFAVVTGDLGEVFFHWAVLKFMPSFGTMGAEGVAICTIFSCVTISETFKALKEGNEFLEVQALMVYVKFFGLENIAPCVWRGNENRVI